MDELEARLHRTWLALLLAGDYREVAALIVESDLKLSEGNHQVNGLIIDVPPSAYAFISNDSNIRQLVETTLRLIVKGHLDDQNGNSLDTETIDITFRVKLLDVEENWQQKIKEQILNAKEANQGIITEKVFARKNNSVIEYNEMKFGSQSEVRIAQEFERRKVLFFPLPLAVRNDTGINYKDHKEVDFLVCHDGTWGILEVSYHRNRYEEDSEKSAWFKRSGILCVEPHTAEKCYNESAKTVDNFLNILSKHKR